MKVFLTINFSNFILVTTLATTEETIITQTTEDHNKTTKAIKTTITVATTSNGSLAKPASLIFLITKAAIAFIYCFI